MRRGSVPMTPASDASGPPGPPELAHKFVSWLGELAASVSAVDAVLLAFAFTIVLVLRASLRATVTVERWPPHCLKKSARSSSTHRSRSSRSHSILTGRCPGPDSAHR